MFSQTVEYALRAMAVLSQSAPNARRTGEIAKSAKIPPAYLVKILQSLSRAGLVQSRRGVHGGVSLQRSSEEISVLDVVNAVEPIRRIRSCPLGLPSHGVNLCPLHSKLDSAVAAIETTFSTTTLAEVTDEKKQKRRCPFPIANRS